MDGREQTVVLAKSGGERTPISRTCLNGIELLYLTKIRI